VSGTSHLKADGPRVSYRRRRSWLGVDESFGIGDILAGKYRIDGILGEGSMGKVFVATDLALGRRAAIKVAHIAVELQAELDRRLLLEARAAARLCGQHVARVLDIGKLRSGAPFVVFELLDGENLEEVLQRKGRLPAREVVDWVLQACIGLAEAHGMGVVHRDIKPENLFLARALDGTVVLKVLDFGASAFLEGLAVPGGKEQVIGTPLYLAPERIQSPRLRDPRSDIWALGAVMFELIAGTLPFDADSVDDICDLVLHHPAPLLSHALPGADAGIERVIDRCLQKAPGRRFTDVGALAMSLAAFGGAGAYELAKRSRRVLAHSSEQRESSLPPPRPLLRSEPLLLTRK
jgi:serine/threonine protein kinase